MIRAGVIAAVVLSCAVVAGAQNRPIADLKDLPPAEIVTSVSYCHGEYDVGLVSTSRSRPTPVRTGRG